MLVLAGKLSESIQVGDDIRITVVQIRPGRVRLGIEAPPHVRIRRDEVVPPPIASVELEFEVAVEVGAGSAW
ncbi:MAG: carbon storage regulator [Planctomycetaceae bacterium]|nr:carbon storage regulator [Planctomycetaceae bacterium]